MHSHRTNLHSLLFSLCLFSIRPEATVTTKRTYQQLFAFLTVFARFGMSEIPHNPVYPPWIPELLQVQRYKHILTPTFSSPFRQLNRTHCGYLSALYPQFFNSDRNVTVKIQSFFLAYHITSNPAFSVCSPTEILFSCPLHTNLSLHSRQTHKDPVNRRWDSSSTNISNPNHLCSCRSACLYHEIPLWFQANLLYGSNSLILWESTMK